MRRIVVDMQNYLFADAIVQALKRADSDFDVRMSESPDKTAELCNLSKPYALLCEVTGYTPWMLEERLKIRDEVKCYSPECKIVLIVDENAEKTLDAYWNALDADNKVSLLVKWIDRETFDAKTLLVNKLG